MIARLKPYFNFKELSTLFRFDSGSVEKFEGKFAKLVGAKFALAFPYGRSAIFSILKSQGIRNKEVIMSAYTCVVVPNAVVFSGNKPKFIDISKESFNTKPSEIKRAINKKTGAIIVTHMYGEPISLNFKKKKAVLIQDCALAFGTKFEKKHRNSDFAVYSLNMGKQLCTIDGGVATTDSYEDYLKLKSFRNRFFNKSLLKEISKKIYFISQMIAFGRFFYPVTKFLEEKTSILDKFTKYYDEKKITMPKDSFVMFTETQARIGLEQLKKAGEIILKRKAISLRYAKTFKKLYMKDFERSSFSHFNIIVDKRDLLISEMRKIGIELGRLFDYSVPELPAYKKYKEGDFKNSLKVSKHIVNLPNYPYLTMSEQNHIINSLKEVMKRFNIKFI